MSIRKKNNWISFSENLRRIGFKSYAAYLDSDLWRKKKAAYRASKRPQKCLCCGDPNYQLHHTTYDRLGREWLKDLIPLCSECHETFHKLLKEDDSLNLSDTKLILDGVRKYRKRKK